MNYAPESTGLAKLEVRHLSKSFRQGRKHALPVLADLTFAVAQLEFLAVVGPSGCGKSTLLCIVDGLMPPDTGEILINGGRVVGPGHGRGMVFQSSDLFPWRTTRANVEFGLEVMGVTRAERREISSHYNELVGLQGFEEAYPHQLSGGMQQRVGIARALAIRPEVLLMDEPFGSLDVQTRDLLQNELLQIWGREQKSVIFVTHSIEEAIYLADRVIVFTPRPARIDRIFDVPFPRPRREGVKTSVPFMEMRGEIWELLKKGVSR